MVSILNKMFVNGKSFRAQMLSRAPNRAYRRWKLLRVLPECISWRVNDVTSNSFSDNRMLNHIGSDTILAYYCSVVDSYGRALLDRKVHGLLPLISRSLKLVLSLLLLLIWGGYLYPAVWALTVFDYGPAPRCHNWLHSWFFLNNWFKMLEKTFCCG
jgi:hypothetical protein